MRSLTRRLILVVMAVVAAAFVLTGALALRIVSAAVTRDFDARLSGALNELVSAVDIGDDGILSLAREPGDPAFSRANSGWYWSISRGATVLARSRSLRSGEALPATASGEDAAKGPNGESLRMQSRETRLRDRSELVVAVAGPERAVRDEIWAWARMLIAAFASVAILLLIALAVVIRSGLKPLRRLADDLDGASRGHPVDIKPPGYRELDPLAGSVRDLMAQVQATVERARAQAGNLAHAIKTPLSLISARNQQRGEARDDDVDLGVRLIKRQIDHHLKRTRFAATTRLASERIAVEPIVDDIVLVMRRSHASRAMEIHSDIEQGSVFLGEREDFEEMLGNVLDNACKWARSRVELTVRKQPGAIEVFVGDDGPGLPDADRERVLARGLRLDETIAGDGIGLSIVADLVALYGGELRLETAAPHGLRVTLRLPSPA
jgi:signal transduction histidine kinase